MTTYFRNLAVLSFNPATVENPRLRDVFADPLARTFWIGIKSGHLTEEHFDDFCLDMALAVRRKGGRVSEQELVKILNGRDQLDPGGYGNDIDFVRELLPYVNGEKTLEHTVADRYK